MSIKAFLVATFLVAFGGFFLTSELDFSRFQGWFFIVLVMGAVLNLVLFVPAFLGHQLLISINIRSPVWFALFGAFMWMMLFWASSFLVGDLSFFTDHPDVKLEPISTSAWFGVMLMGSLWGGVFRWLDVKWSLK